MKKILVVALIIGFICVMGMAAKTADLDITLKVLKHSSVELGWKTGSTGAIEWDPATDPNFDEDYTQYASCTIRTNSGLKITTGFNVDWIYGVADKGIKVTHMSDAGDGNFTNEVFGDYTETFPYSAAWTDAGVAVFDIMFQFYKVGEWDYWDYENGTNKVTYTITIENQ